MSAEAFLATNEADVWTRAFGFHNPSHLFNRRGDHILDLLCEERDDQRVMVNMEPAVDGLDDDEWSTDNSELCKGYEFSDGSFIVVFTDAWQVIPPGGLARAGGSVETWWWHDEC